MNNLFFGFAQGFVMAGGGGSMNELDYGLVDVSGNVTVGGSGSSPPCPGSDCNAGNNGTDLPSSYTGIIGYNYPQPGGQQLGTSIPLPPYPNGNSMTCGPSNTGSCRNLDPNQVFVHPVFGADAGNVEDWRLCTAALCGHAAGVEGAGQNFSVGSYFGTLSTASPDPFGQSRGSRVDLGVVQATSAAQPPPVRGGGFRLFR